MATTTPRPLAGVRPLITTAEVCDFAPGEGSADAAGDWVPVDVPGDVHTALVAAGRIEHPFYDRNENDCTWMEEREWWYRASFDDPGPAPGERLRLVFHGLDTYATVFLNGEELGRHANMFREASFDVTELVRGRELARDPLRPAAPARAARATPSSGRARPPSACGCARRSTGSAGTGARGCRRSGSGARSSCGASASRRSRA